MKRLCLHWPNFPTIASWGGGAPHRAYLRNGTKRDSGSCILQMENVLGEQTSAPMCLGSRSSVCIVLTQPYAPRRAKEGLGCPWLRGHCCLAGGVRSWKPTPNVFSFAEKADFAGRSPVCTGPSYPRVGCQGGTHLGPISSTAQHALPGAAFCKGKLCSGNKPQPPCGLAQNRSACLVLT